MNQEGRNALNYTNTNIYNVLLALWVYVKICMCIFQMTGK